MGACCSSMVSWYRWMLGPRVVSQGLPRFAGDTVDGEALSELLLIDADPDVLELGQGAAYITDRERVSLQTGRYDDIVHYSASDGFEQRSQENEKRLREEEEAGYEAKREQARAARQAQSIEASRAAATAVAVAQATNLALRQNGDMFISAAAPMGDSPSVPRSTHGAASSESTSASATTENRPSEGVAPLSLSGLRGEPETDPSRAQLQAFEQSTRKSAAKSSSSPATSKRTSGPADLQAKSSSVLTASATTVGVQRQPVLTNHSNPKLMQREPPPFPDDAEENPLSHDQQLAQFEAAGFAASTEVQPKSDELVDTQDASSFSIVEDSDDDDFDSFLENVKAKAMAGSREPDSVAEPVSKGNDGASASAAASPIAAAADAAASVTVVEDDEQALAVKSGVEVTVDADDEFTSFEDSVR